jgi:3-hydroxyacyl-CoA dehydrogenase / enoyl-CoA hydratase / 3-hydroxybutyryl-CoA epimerase
MLTLVIPSEVEDLPLFVGRFGGIGLEFVVKRAENNPMPAILTGETIKREVDENGICTLTFDRSNSGANIFDAATIQQLDEHLVFIEGEKSLRGVVIASAKKSIFIAGADLKTLLGQAQTGELRAFIAEGQRVFNRVAMLQIPTCAAIHGACAGGGYEITLACDWRVASDDPATRIGLPETTLGLVPAWGGATRLPRLIGAEKAAEVITKGKLHTAAEALQIGLIDQVVSREQLLDAAHGKLREGKRPSFEGRAAPRPASQELRPPARAGNAAPARALDVITKGLGSSIEESLRMELDAIVELGETEATQNLIRNFFLAEKYKKGKSTAIADKIVHAAVIGAGVMGSGIAQWLSSRGVSVILRDVATEQLKRGLANIERTYLDAVKRGIMTEEKATEGRARVVASTAPITVRDVQMVIEAASEKLEIKKQIFRDLVEKAPKALILATNTSALPISDLAAETNSPDRVIGLHFFNPVSRMKLVEVVVGEQTSDETIERSLAFVRQIAKLPVVVRDSPGFLVNRVLFPYLLDAAELFESGVSAQQIDDALLQWGMPMGPLRLIDEIGLDVTVDIANTLQRAYGRRDQVSSILRKMQDAKLLGRKSGSGFYKYEGKSHTPNTEIEQWRKASGHLERSEGPHGNRDREVPRFARNDSDDAIARRLIFLMVNESVRCLEEQVVATPEDADYGMILGTGFAPHRGGPLRFAEHYGLPNVVAELDRLAQSSGAKFTPCALLRQHAQNGTRFYEL